MGRPVFRQLPEEAFSVAPILPIGDLTQREVGAPTAALTTSTTPATVRSEMTATTPAGTAAARRRRAAELYRLYGAAAYRRCLRLLGHPEEARDATQEVFARLVQNLAALERRETVLPWIYRVATNHCLNVIRDRGGRPRDVREGDEGAHQDDAAAASGGAPELTLARAILSRFDAGTQAIAVAILVDGMDCEELARALGVSRRTVSRKVERFLEKARALADDQGAAASRVRSACSAASASELRTMRSGV
ncbi:MAG TPA: sigma-70 family RNA polymerase sigma factor [Anaeromyxobacteraceae bacterium]|nr:sigma-70 family RNA polymerase sigma factor [Anaeromyxobacteraceae bacterium]